MVSKEGTYHCPRCGSRRVQGTAWVELNGDEPTNDEPPSDCYFCPDCDMAGRDGHFEKHVCMSDGAGRCQLCKETIKENEDHDDEDQDNAG